MKRVALREVVGDWLTVLGAAGLFVSLFLVWSHQFPAAFLARWADSPQLRGVPASPTAWQVYSIADALLALLAAALLAVALVGGPRVRAGVLAAALVALAFTLHALADAPTNHATVFGLAPDARSGPGEVVAIAGLGVAIAGLGLAVPPRRRR